MTSDANETTSSDLNTGLGAASATAATSALDPHLPLSAEKVATMLSVHRADVMELVHEGRLPAKRIAGETFITRANLDAFMAEPDPASAFSRFGSGDLVVWMDERGDHGVGRFVAENPDGSVCVLRDGFWGEYESAFPATQVQPFTCRVAPTRRQ